MVAIALMSITPGLGAEPITAQVLTEALLAGAGFGLFFILLDATDGATAPWPIVGARR